MHFGYKVNQPICRVKMILKVNWTLQALHGFTKLICMTPCSTSMLNSPVKYRLMKPNVNDCRLHWYVVMTLNVDKEYIYWLNVDVTRASKQWKKKVDLHTTCFDCLGNNWITHNQTHQMFKERNDQSTQIRRATMKTLRTLVAAEQTALLVENYIISRMIKYNWLSSSKLGHFLWLNQYYGEQQSIRSAFTCFSSRGITDELSCVQRQCILMFEQESGTWQHAIYQKSIN